MWPRVEKHPYFACLSGVAYTESVIGISVADQLLCRVSMAENETRYLVHTLNVWVTCGFRVGYVWCL